MRWHLALALLASAFAVFAAGCASDDDDRRYSSDGIGDTDKPTEENPTVDPDDDDADDDMPDGSGSDK